MTAQPHKRFVFCVVVVEFAANGNQALGKILLLLLVKPSLHKANFDHKNDHFPVKTKRLLRRMTAQAHNRFVFSVVVVEFTVNGNQA